MFNYIYQSDYSDGSESQNLDDFESILHLEQGSAPVTKLSEMSPLVVNAWMYAVVDWYQISEVKNLSKMKLQANLIESWNNNFLDFICSVYISTPENDRELRDLVASYAAKHIHSLWDWEDFKLVIKEIHDFMMNLLYLVTEFM